MKLIQLEAFCVVIKAGSISEAARLMHLTQPALSLQIRELEEYFQTQLLERSNKGVTATAVGEVVYKYAQKLMSMKEALHEDIQKIQRNETPRLRIGASTVVGGYALPCSIYAFKEKHPYADISLTVAPSKVILEMMIDGRINVAVVEGPPFASVGQMAEKTMARTIGHDDLVLVASPDNLPEDKTELTLDELRQLPIIIREEGSGMRASLESLLAEKGMALAELNIVMETNSLDAIKTSVVAGQGFAMLSYLTVRKELYNGTLKALQIEGLSGRTTFTLLHSKHIFSSPVEKKFVDFMRSKNRSLC